MTWQWETRGQGLFSLDDLKSYYWAGGISAKIWTASIMESIVGAKFKKKNAPDRGNNQDTGFHEELRFTCSQMGQNGLCA